ncbi:15341_t:CDS:2 [Funneliformis geosporum]|uniref:15341_t:CDS:1 n=1 Tax=Funneliformis geosporum TaxID=1117311 RepID=A0A9W4SWN2_9GLOM|nr:15341_t:CDS:2 [Funneliformis geosporum]
MKGLYPKVLEKLFIRKNSLKRRLSLLNNRKEELEKEINLAEARGENITDTLKSKYSSVFFIVACLDAKQLTLKVRWGNISWSIEYQAYCADLIRSIRFSVKYGNTDSLYLVCLEECFQKCDEAYDNDNEILKEEY